MHRDLRGRCWPGPVLRRAQPANILMSMAVSVDQRCDESSQNFSRGIARLLHTISYASNVGTHLPHPGIPPDVDGINGHPGSRIVEPDHQHQIVLAGLNCSQIVLSRASQNQEAGQDTGISSCVERLNSFLYTLAFRNVGRSSSSGVVVLPRTLTISCIRHPHAGAAWFHG
jgi:hypothetical protein